MKKIHRVFAMLMAAIMALSLVTTVFAAEPTIDASKKASLSIYKYDITKASEDGVWDAESYVSTGLHDDAVIDKLSKYAIQGVEFTYLRIADIAMNNEVMDGPQRFEDKVKQMTSVPAQWFGIEGRGVLAEGNWADIVVLDRERLCANEGNGSPEGVDYVIINGQIAADHRKHTGVLAGKVLRKARH